MTCGNWNFFRSFKEQQEPKDMSNTSEIFDYLTTNVHLSSNEQFARFEKMHLKEIEERSTILRDLMFDKAAAKKRIKSYIEWGFDFFETPAFINKVDDIVDRVYQSKLPTGW